MVEKNKKKKHKKANFKKMPIKERLENFEGVKYFV